MAVDTSIFNMLGRGVKSVADYDREAMESQQNMLAIRGQRMKMDEMQRGVQRQRNLLALSSRWNADTTDDQRTATLKNAGYFDEADKLEKTLLERQKTGAEVLDKTSQAKTRDYTLQRSMLEHGIQSLQASRTPQQAAAEVQAGVAKGYWSMADATKKLAAIPQDQGQFEQWRADQLRRILAAEKQLPKIETRNLGGTTQTAAIDPLTGAVNVTGTVANTQSPDSMASNATTRRGQDLVNQRAIESNRLKQTEIENNRESGLPALGVPVPTVMPWANQSNPKDANKVKAAEMSRGSKEVEKDVDSARKEAATAQAAARFIELNKSVPTGGLTDKVAIGRWLQGMGSDYAELEAITARLAPAMREPGSGASSDYDAKQFERATVGVDKPKAANENIANAIIARAKLAQDYADFRNTYLEQNGTLAGADRHWKGYVDKNPIFNPQKAASFELNKSRKSWGEHFKGTTKTESPKPATPATPAKAKFLGFEGQ